MQGREEDKVNGLTRAGGKQMQVMPDGSLTVIWESSDRMRLRWASYAKPGGTAEVITTLLSQ